MTLKTYTSIRSISMTAVLSCIAVVVASFLVGPRSSFADTSPPNVLAAELLIVRGDLERLKDASNLPPAHVRGLRNRVEGALGILPWLLRQAGDRAGADQLRNSTHDDIIKKLDQMIGRHPLDLSPYAPDRLTAKLRREAFTIHDAYCAGCHDGAGQGNEDTALPARDLFLLAHESHPETFLARLINGVRGDEALLFINPLTRDQVAALWWYYQRRRQKRRQHHQSAARRGQSCR